MTENLCSPLINQSWCLSKGRCDDPAVGISDCLTRCYRSCPSPACFPPLPAGSAQGILWKSPTTFLSLPLLPTVWEITLAVSVEDSLYRMPGLSQLTLHMATSCGDCRIHLTAKRSCTGGTRPGCEPLDPGIFLARVWKGSIPPSLVHELD